MSQSLGERRQAEALMSGRGFWGQMGQKNKPREATEGILRARADLGYPPDSVESVSPPSDRDDQYAPASEDRDDVLGPTLKATHDPLTSLRFGRRGEPRPTPFANGILHVC